MKFFKIFAPVFILAFLASCGGSGPESESPPPTSEDSGQEASAPGDDTEFVSVGNPPDLIPPPPVSMEPPPPISSVEDSAPESGDTGYPTPTLAMGGNPSYHDVFLPPSAPRTSIMHVWAPFTVMGSEPTGYAFYTYLLVNRHGMEGAAEERANALLRAIRGSTGKAGSGEIKKLANIFLIPGSKMTYSFESSLRITAIFQKMLFDLNRASIAAKMSNPGPFLVSIPRPVQNVFRAFYQDKKHPILIADLSRTNPAIMGDVVRQYKARVHQGSKEPAEEFKSLSLSLANILTNADDSLHLLTLHMKDIAS